MACASFIHILQYYVQRPLLITKAIARNNLKLKEKSHKVLHIIIFHNIDLEHGDIWGDTCGQGDIYRQGLVSTQDDICGQGLVIFLTTGGYVYGQGVVVFMVSGSFCHRG